MAPPKKHDITVTRTGERAEYMRQFRRANPDYYRRARARNTARQAAALRVAKNHPDEFEAFLAEELTARGVGPSPNPHPTGDGTDTRQDGAA